MDNKDAQKISTGTVIRTIMTFSVVVYLLLKSAGVEFLPDNIFEPVGAVAESAVIICSWWFNNSFTENARKADNVMNLLNSGNEIEIITSKKNQTDRK